WQPGRGPSFALQTTLRPFTWGGTTTWVGDGLRAQPGGAWEIDYDLAADLSLHEQKYGEFETLVVAVQAWRKHDARGTWHPGMTTLAVSSTLSVTGMPIERFNGWPTLKLLHGKDGSPFEAVAEHPIDGSVRAAHRLSGRLTVDLPENTPEGWYQPRVLVGVRVAGAQHPVWLDNYGDNSNTQDEQILPMVEVGSPAPPRLPVALASDRHFRGQAGTLSETDKQRHRLVGRAGFPRRFVVVPGQYDMGPAFPTHFPERIISPVDGGFDVVPELVRSYLDPASLKVTLTLDGRTLAPHPPGPGGEDDEPGDEPMPVGPGFDARHGGFGLDLTRTGKHTVRMEVEIDDLFGRTFVAGGDYVVWSAWPLSFSTSVKPGTNFLVGEGYPAKVNVNPSFPADIEVTVDYYPGSDPTRRVEWRSGGTANRFGHFFPYDVPPIVFDEPGEYVSHLVASWTDARGTLWMGDQVSAGVVAPLEPEIHLHGTRSPPWNLKIDEEWYGGKKRFEDRIDARAAYLPFKPGQIPDTFAPYEVEDTLFVQANGFKENIIEPHLSLAVDDADLRQRLQQGHVQGTVLPPPTLQLAPGDWYYLEDVVQVSADSAAWFPADADHADELPAAPVGDGDWHPFVFPEGNRIDAHLTLGVVRPGFPVMTSIFQTDAIGLYWLASPNRFGYHFNTSQNGDLPGDFYRIQAGVVLRDHQTGRTLYDAWSASITVVPDDGTSTSISAPGARDLVTTSDREHPIFVGQDSHDALDVGEMLYLGGMVAPAVLADVEWTVTKPDGTKVPVKGTANRLGIVRGKPGVLIDQQGVYDVHTAMRWKGDVGDTLGTARGSFQHFAVPPGNERLLSTTLPAVTRVAPTDQLEIPLRWPADLENTRLSFGVLMPGRVLDQGWVEPPEPEFEYRFTPRQVAVQHSNYDARNFALGQWETADTVVLQFFLEGTRDGETVVDALRFALRGNVAYNYEALLRDGFRPPTGRPEGRPSQGPRRY
ncbi:MAG: hypothetical protein KDA24_29555, partial [Deltaproteobacteria bacterium]|nr:hypothetical protein [Deltaproteobacteria bacterium]